LRRSQRISYRGIARAGKPIEKQMGEQKHRESPGARINDQHAVVPSKKKTKKRDR